MESETIRSKLLADFPNAELHIRDLTGTGDHWQVDIKSAMFVGLSLVEQHQLVYRSLDEFVNKGIHALSLNTTAKDQD